MQLLRIRQAEVALADRRLDHVFDLVREHRLDEHARGQRLLSHLVRALVARGREHMKAGRLEEAMADCERARRVGGNLADVGDLRTRTLQAMLDRQRQRDRKDRTIDAARQHLHAGRLSACQRVLHTMDTQSQRIATLRQQADLARADRAALLASAEAAVTRDDWSDAADRLAALRDAGEQGQPAAELYQRATSGLLEAAQSALVEGRLSIARIRLDQLHKLAPQHDQVHELNRALNDCQTAAAGLASGDPRRAVEALRRVATLMPRAKWIADALKHATQAAESLDALRGGPLSLLMVEADSASGAVPTIVSRSPAQPRNAEPRNPEPGTRNPALPSRFFLQIDGVGSVLVIRDSSVTVGPISSARRPVVGLVTDPTSPVVTISREDDDYFMTSEQKVHVNGDAATSRLLVDEDKIALSPRCRMKFRLPNAASTSAVLDLSAGGAKLPRGDVQRVVLMDAVLIIGPAASAHVRTSAVDEPIVLQVRDGKLCCRAKQNVTANDQPLHDDAPVPIGAHVRVGDLGMIVTEA